MEEVDTLNVLNEIEKKCQERAEENDEKDEGRIELENCMDGIETVTEHSNDHNYVCSGSKIIGTISLNSNNEHMTEEVDKALNGDIGNDHVTISINTDMTDGVEEQTSEGDDDSEQAEMDADDTEKTEDLGPKLIRVNGNLSDDHEDRNSDIVDIDINVDAEAHDDSDTTSVDLSEEMAYANAENHSNNDTVDNVQTEDHEHDSISIPEGEKSAISQGDSSDQCNNTGVSNEGESFESSDLNNSPRKPGRPRKRRKRWGKGWSPISQYKARKLNSIVYRRSKDSTSVDKGTDADLDDTAENGIGNLSAGADGDANQEDQDDDRPRKNLARDTRRSSGNTDFIVGEEAMDRLIQDTAVPKIKKRKSLLIDHGQKIVPKKVAPLSPEVFEKVSEPFKHGWQRELVVRGVCSEVTSSGKPKSRPMDVYYRPPVGAKLRSMVQIQEWLVRENSHLTSDNFTFMRRPIGVKEGEVVRHASASRGPGSRGRIPTEASSLKKKRFVRRSETQYHDDDDPLYDKPEVVIERDSDEFLTPIIAAGLGRDLPPVRFDTSCTSGSPKRGRPRKSPIVLKIKAVKQEKVETMQPSNEEVIVTPTKFIKIKPTARKSTTPKPFKVVKKAIPYTGTESLCTLRCPGLEGMAPMLMCKKCMCLFHNECVNHFDDDIDFICLRCQESKSATALDPSLVLRVSMPIQFGQLDQTSIAVTSMPTEPSVSTSSNWSLPVASLIGPSFPCSSPQQSAPIIKHTTLSISPAAPAKTSVPTVASLLSNKSKFQVIKPLVRVKDEPKDSSYDGSKLPLASQASSEALGSLKNILNARNSPAGSKDFTEHFLGAHVDMNRAQVSPRMSTPVSLIKNRKQQSPVVRPVASPMNLISNTPLQLSQNSNYRLVPIGPPVSLPNIPFQPIRLPGMTMQGLMPLGNMPLPMHTMPSPINSNLTTFGDLQKSPMTSSKSSTTTQSLNSLSNMVSMVEAQEKQTSPKGKSVSGGGSQAARLVIDGTTIGAPETGQLLTLPGAVSKKLTLSKPLVLKIKNRQISVPPSGFFQAKDGLKIFVPPNTFPTVEEEMENSTHTEKDTGAEKNTSPSKTQSSKSSDETLKDVSVVSCAKVTGDICRTRRYRTCCLIQKLYGGYDCMYHLFRFLNIKELMAVSLVCRTWKMISLHPSLWNDASFRGLRVSSWAKAMAFLRARGVSSISLLGMTPYDDLERTWNGFITSVGDVPSLQSVTFGLVPPIVLDSACLKLSHLQSLCAECVSSEDGESMWTSPTRLDIGKFGSLTKLKELRLKGVCGLTLPTFSLCGGIGNLAALTYLETLGLTSLKNVEGSKFHFISELKNLRELALGECRSWTSETYAVLGEQTSLRKLRLEHGGEIPDPGLGEAISKLQNLHTLELYTYTIAETFTSHVKQLPKLRTLVIWPDNSSQPAQVNSNTLSAVRDLHGLERLKWVIQNRASNSIVLDDNDNSETVSKEQEWIPFLSEKEESQELQENMQKTEYVGVRQLTENLSSLLPDTRINVYCLKADQETQEAF